MKLLRTIPSLTRLLVGLFLVVQFAGMVSSPCANALPLTVAGLVQGDGSQTGASGIHHHAQGHGNHGRPDQHNHGANLADTCCALHACCAGVLPLAVAIATETLGGEPLLAGPDNVALGAPGARLDRPPRPLH